LSVQSEKIKAGVPYSTRRFKI